METLLKASAKSLESSIVVYWVYPPSETNPTDYGRPMRMSYSAITDPCLSSEVLHQIDKVRRGGIVLFLIISRQIFTVLTVAY